MASYEGRFWLADGSGVTRKHRQSCEYRVYIPDKLADRTFVFDGDVAADILISIHRTARWSCVLADDTGIVSTSR